MIPWFLPGEHERRANLLRTTATAAGINVVLMGSKSFKYVSVAKNNIPIVLSRGPTDLRCRNEQALVVNDNVDRVMGWLDDMADVETVFIIGGATVINEAIVTPAVRKFYVTRVEGDFDCDKFVNLWDLLDKNKFKRTDVSELMEEYGIKYRFEVYERIWI